MEAGVAIIPRLCEPEEIADCDRSVRAKKLEVQISAHGVDRRARVRVVGDELPEISFLCGRDHLQPDLTPTSDGANHDGLVGDLIRTLLGVFKLSPLASV